MARTLTKNASDELTWTEKVYDDDEEDVSHPLTEKVELDKVDGTSQSGSDRNPPWLDAVVTELGVVGGRWEEEVDVTVDATALDPGTTYTFLYRGTDGKATTDLLRELKVGSLTVFEGSRLYVVGAAGDDAYEYHASTKWDASSLSFQRSFDVSGQDTDPEGIYFKPDGTKMYVVGLTSDSIHEYDLSTAWDVTSATLLQSASISTQAPNPTGIWFKPDGTKLYVSESTNADVDEYDLSTAWDVSTLTHVQGLDVSGQDAAPAAVSLNHDGTKLFVLGNGSTAIYEYDLSTAYDVSTATFSQSQDVSGQDTDPTGMFIRSDGLKLYLAGSQNDNVYEYDFTTSFDVSTLSLNQTFDVSGQDTDPNAVLFGGPL